MVGECFDLLEVLGVGIAFGLSFFEGKKVVVTLGIAFAVPGLYALKSDVWSRIDDNQAEVPTGSQRFDLGRISNRVYDGVGAIFDFCQDFLGQYSEAELLAQFIAGLDQVFTIRFIAT